MHLFTFENYLFRRHIAIESCNRSFVDQSRGAKCACYYEAYCSQTLNSDFIGLSKIMVYNFPGSILLLVQNILKTEMNTNIKQMEN